MTNLSSVPINVTKMPVSVVCGPGTLESYASKVTWPSLSKSIMTVLIIS
jgi:hypothetical protein